MKNKLNKMILGLAAMAMSGASANAAVIYESFDYSTGALSTQSSSAWGGNAQVATPGLTYGDLATTGNTATVDGQNASFNIGSLLTGLLDHGDTLWFSVVVNINMGTNQGFGFALGTDILNATNGTPMANNGDGLGFRGKSGLAATAWSAGTSVATTSANIGNSVTTLVVGEMIFGAEDLGNLGTYFDDTINLYTPDSSLNMGSVIKSQTGNFDQTLWDTITFSSKSATSGDSVDEIRFGTSYAAVTPIPEPSAAFLGGLGCLLLLRRRK